MKLRCCCCGEYLLKAQDCSVPGERDHGYGLCPPCAKSCILRADQDFDTPVETFMQKIERADPTHHRLAYYVSLRRTKAVLETTPEAFTSRV